MPGGRQLLRERFTQPATGVAGQPPQPGHLLGALRDRRPQRARQCFVVIGRCFARRLSRTPASSAAPPGSSRWVRGSPSRSAAREVRVARRALRRAGPPGVGRSCHAPRYWASGRRDIVLPCPPCAPRGQHPPSYCGSLGPPDIQEVGTAFPFPGCIRPVGSLPRLPTPPTGATRSAGEPDVRGNLLCAEPSHVHFDVVAELPTVPGDAEEPGLHQLLDVTGSQGAGLLQDNKPRPDETARIVKHRPIPIHSSTWLSSHLGFPTLFITRPLTSDRLKWTATCLASTGQNMPG